MLKAIKVENFKSTRKIHLSFGNINLFIGANGTGKSTILEALAFAIASENDKLNTELLEIRGIRITEPDLMRSGFTKENKEPISIELTLGNESDIVRSYKVDNSNEAFSNWKIIKDTILKKDSDPQIAGDSISIGDYTNMLRTNKVLNDLLNNTKLKKLFKKDSEFEAELKKDFSEIQKIINSDEFSKFSDLIEEAESDVKHRLQELIDFAIYSPEYRELRNPYKEGALKPLGIHGEGLLKLYRNICLEQPEDKEDIEEGLELIEWYDSIDMPSELEDDLSIGDRYLPNKINQRSTNEGFLYILFYMCLIVSKKTPKIFAIDNIDTALNPSLCREVIKLIVRMSKKYGKQIFLTAHNPAILDGLDLESDDERLFVVSRARVDGSTKIKRIDSSNKPKIPLKHIAGESLPLSEAMLRGYIPNALPKGF